MTWTYNAAALSTSDLYKVRLIIGDTDSTWPLLEDEEIQFVLTHETSPTLAAAVCCDVIAAEFARQCNTENSELRVSAAARHKHYQDLAERLRAGGAGDVPGDTTTILAEMYVGGAKHSETEERRDDTDLVKPQFEIGQDDNPEVSEEAAEFMDEEA